MPLTWNITQKYSFVDMHAALCLFQDFDKKQILLLESLILSMFDRSQLKRQRGEQFQIPSSMESGGNKSVVPCLAWVYPKPLLSPSL